VEDRDEVAFSDYELERRTGELIEICKKFTGEYLPSHHGPGSWATTYSTQFIKASSELFLILQKRNRKPCLTYLQEIYNKNGIRSCRGSHMNGKRVAYLYEEHIWFQLRHGKVQIQKPRVETAPCLLCGDLVSDMKQHIIQTHTVIDSDIPI